jgi:hypothetical protein
MNDLFGPLCRKEARLRPILAALSPIERESLYRYYNLGEGAAGIFQDLGIPQDQFQELRARVRSKFLASEQSQ